MNATIFTRENGEPLQVFLPNIQTSRFSCIFAFHKGLIKVVWLPKPLKNKSLTTCRHEVPIRDQAGV